MTYRVRYCDGTTLTVTPAELDHILRQSRPVFDVRPVRP